MKVTKKRILWAVLAVVLVLAAVWAKRALPERLNAISAMGGEVFTMPPIETAHYLQKDARWENDTIGGTSERLARVGCTVCSLAMALDHYGVKTTPKELNEFLKRNDGYTIRGWLKWNSVSNFTAGKVWMGYIGRPSHARIDQALKGGQPVIGKVFINGIIPHWVLIVGKEQNDYLMHDPLDEAKTVKRLSEYRSKIYALRILQNTDSTNMPEAPKRSDSR